MSSRCVDVTSVLVKVIERISARSMLYVISVVSPRTMDYCIMIRTPCFPALDKVVQCQVSRQVFRRSVRTSCQARQWSRGQARYLRDCGKLRHQVIPKVRQVSRRRQVSRLSQVSRQIPLQVCRRASRQVHPQVFRQVLRRWLCSHKRSVCRRSV